MRTKFDLFYIFLLTNSYCHLPLFLLCKSHHHYCNYVSLVGIIQSFFIKQGQNTFFFYYYVCLSWLPWNSFACRKHIPGRRGIVCAQTSPGWVAGGLVSTPLPSILWPITVESSPTHNIQKNVPTLLKSFVTLLGPRKSFHLCNSLKNGLHWSTNCDMNLFKAAVILIRR